MKTLFHFTFARFTGAALIALGTVFAAGCEVEETPDGIEIEETDDGVLEDDGILDDDAGVDVDVDENGVEVETDG